MDFIIDLDGKKIQVTNMEEALMKTDMFRTFDVSNIELTAYWEDMFEKLLALNAKMKLKSIVVDKPQGEELLPTIVREIREERRNSNFLLNNPDEYKGKLFIKNDKRSPLYGAHSCVRTDENLNRLNKLEIGETWDRGQFSNKITRVY